MLGERRVQIDSTTKCDVGSELQQSELMVRGASLRVASSPALRARAAVRPAIRAQAADSTALAGDEDQIDTALDGPRGDQDRRGHEEPCCKTSSSNSMFTVEKGQSEKAGAATSVAVTIRVMTLASSTTSAVAVSGSVVKVDIDNTSVRTEDQGLRQEQHVSIKWRDVAPQRHNGGRNEGVQRTDSGVDNMSKAGYSLMSFVSCVHPACRSRSLKRTTSSEFGGMELEEHRAQIQRDD